jgi:serine/threonine protein kinase
MSIKPHSQAEYVNDVRQHVGYFEPNGHMLLGSSSSGHGVVFGEMPGLGEVAVKPFTTVAKARQEEAALERIRAIPDLDAVEPLVVAEGGLGAYLVTRYRDDLSHLSEVDWRTRITQRQELNGVIVPTLRQVAATTADLHRHHVTHGDWKPRNIHYTATGKPIVVDAEQAKFFTHPKHHANTANKDLRVFGEDVLYHGLLVDRSPSYRVGFLTEELLDRYLEAVNGDQFSQSPEERRKAITDYWVQASRPGYSKRHQSKVPAPRRRLWRRHAPVAA